MRVARLLLPTTPRGGRVEVALVHLYEGEGGKEGPVGQL